MQHNKLRDKIAELVGEASVAWSEYPKGIFNADKAVRIVNDLENLLHTHDEELIEKVEGLNLDEYTKGGLLRIILTIIKQSQVAE